MAIDHKERLARNETLFRELNERINAVAGTLGGDDHAYEFVCECSDSHCTVRITLDSLPVRARSRRCDSFRACARPLDARDRARRRPRGRPSRDREGRCRCRRCDQPRSSHRLGRYGALRTRVPPGLGRRDRPRAAAGAGRRARRLDRGLVALHLHGHLGDQGARRERTLRSGRPSSSARSSPRRGGYLGGHLSDHFGRRRLILVGWGGSVLYSRSSSSSAQNLVLGLVPDDRHGVFGSIGSAADQAMVADLVPPEKHEAAYASVRVASNLGVTLGPPLGGLMLLLGDWNGLFVGVALLSAAAAARLPLHPAPRRLLAGGAAGARLVRRDRARPALPALPRSRGCSPTSSTSPTRWRCRSR